MPRWLALGTVVVFAGSSGCTCGRTNAVEPADAGPAALSVEAAIPSVSEAPASIFSAPIAGARLAGGDAIAAGLVVEARAIVAARVDGKGRAAWTRPIVPGVVWSADAELHAWPIVGGAVVVWRGPVGGKSAHVAVVLSSDGRVLGGPIDVGPLACATDDGLAWTEPAPGGGARVTLRTWPSGAPAHDDVGPPITDELTLSCGDHRAFATVEGDEATPTRVFSVNPAATVMNLPPLALGRDEERDLFTWAEGDELGLVRIAMEGTVQAIDAKGVRSEKARVVPEDDVVGVDADEKQVVLASTHDESDACPDGRGGSSVHALRIPRAGGAATSVEVAKAACGKDFGPFWMNRSGRRLVLGWAERSTRAEKTSAPITGFSFRAFEEGAGTEHVAQAADAIADAGCDDQRCYAVALVRAPGSDGMKPAPIVVLGY